MAKRDNPLIQDNPRDTLNHAACMCDFIAEMTPTMSEDGLSEHASFGLFCILESVAYMLRETSDQLVGHGTTVAEVSKATRK